MEKNATFSVIKEDGRVLGPAGRYTVLRWVEKGSIDVNDQLMLENGTRLSVMQDDDLRVLLEAAQSSAMRHPGLRDVLVGALMLSVAVGLTVSAVLVPQALNLVAGHGTFGMSQVIGWVIMGVLFVGGGMLLFRGLRERKRAQVLDAEIF